MSGPKEKAPVLWAVMVGEWPQSWHELYATAVEDKRDVRITENGIARRVGREARRVWVQKYVPAKGAR